MMRSDYVIITPIYNDGDYVRRTIESVLKQTILPKKWVFVNDGSTDDSVGIIGEYSSNYPWILCTSISRAKREFGTHVYEAFVHGLELLKGIDFDFLVKLDSDLDIDSEKYFESQLERFYQNPKLGITSGITYSIVDGTKVLTKNRPSWRTGGAAKMYRKSCYIQFGGIAPIFGWDGLDDYKAMYLGWETKTWFDLHINHLGKKRAIDREKKTEMLSAKGKSYYQRGYPFWFIILKSMHYLKSGVNKWYMFIKGYVTAVIKKETQCVSREEKRFVHAFNVRRLLSPKKGIVRSMPCNRPEKRIPSDV